MELWNFSMNRLLALSGLLLALAAASGAQASTLPITGVTALITFSTYGAALLGLTVAGMRRSRTAAQV